MVERRRETEEDLRNEHRAMKLFTRLRYKKVEPPHDVTYPFDMVVFKGKKIVALCEIKRRYNNFGKYPTIFVSASKIQRLAQCQMQFAPHCYYLALMNDGLYYAPISHNVTRYWAVEWGDNKKRDDRNDEEPVVHIPNAYFIKADGNWD
jgi:hypothetical protein